MREKKQKERMSERVRQWEIISFSLVFFYIFIEWKQTMLKN